MTTAPSASDALKHYAHRVQLGSPKEWEDFLQVLDAYTHEVVITTINTAPDSILVQQGRAQAYLWLLQLLRTCGTPKATPNPPPTGP